MIKDILHAGNETGALPIGMHPFHFFSAKNIPEIDPFTR